MTKDQRHLLTCVRNFTQAYRELLNAQGRIEDSVTTRFDALNQSPFMPGCTDPFTFEDLAVWTEDLEKCNFANWDHE